MRNRPRVSLPLAVTLGLVASLTLAGGMLAAETTLTAALEGGAAEVPTGDPDGSGEATVVIDPAEGTVCWEFTTTNVGPGTQSHIHEAPAGVAGDVVVPLDVDGFEESSESCTEDQDAALLQSILDSPADFYVNVHTDDFPAGAVRGQLAAGTVPSTALPMSDGSPLLLGLLLLALAAAIALRGWRPIATRD
jgi:hypothetical protein